jgi:hypothetical protein
MTTTIERLRLLAAEYRRKAEGLELAADELNGHYTERAQDRMAQTITRAVTVRRAARKAPRTTRRSKKGTHPRHADLSKVRLVAQVLKDAGKPLTTKELSTAYKAAGGTGHLTGIINYVRQGYIAQSRGTQKGHHSYRFKTMPEQTL